MMNANAQIDGLLVEVLKKPEDEREEYLDLVCRDDDGLRRELAGLLAISEEAGDFLECPAVQVSETVLSPLCEDPGTTIGRYKLLQRIGEGGFGVVYMAEQQEPVRRKVALKIIKLGMDTKQVIARFEAERQALAMMEHPNIAGVLDAGATETGRPYFVMELVKGIPITEYCDKNHLSTKERLDLFMAVCSAIQHAHQKGVIHRDIKPSNVMVTLRDGVPTPKVIDFGIAKATNQRFTEKTYFTEYHQFIGTPAYMSPEQAEISELDVDTRSDIYSLGVLLYELLTGATPFDLKTLREAAYGEIQRIICEVEPPKPSTRLSTLASEPCPSESGSASLEEIARRRRTDPSALSKLIRGDLDWIVMKALEKDRTRRYETARELATDVEHHLANEPILASPPAVIYKLRKFVKRNRVAATAGLAVAVALVVGLMLSTIGFVQASRQRDRAEAARVAEVKQRELADRLRDLAIEAEQEARRQAMRVRAHSILASAAAAKDPLLKALLLDEIAEVRELPGRLGIAHEAASTPLPIRVFRGHEGPVKSAAFSPDGTRIVTGASDGVRIWRIDGGEELRTDGGHEDWVRSATFSPDGTRILTASDDRTARLWRVDGSGEPVVLSGHKRWVRTAAFSPDGDRVVTASWDGTARVWAADGTEAPVVLWGHVDEVRSAAFSPDGTRVVTASADGSARVWQADGTGDPLILRGHADDVLGAAFDPDGTRVATASADGTVRLWSAQDGEQIMTLRGHAGPVHDVRFSPEGDRVVTASGDGTGRIWSLEIPKDVPAPEEWRFDEPQPDWKPVEPIPPQSQAVVPIRTEDALRLPLTEANPSPVNPRVLAGFIYVELPDWRLEDWAYVEIRARASEGMLNMGLFFNYTEKDTLHPDDIPFYSDGDRDPLVTDGTVHTYRLSLDSPRMRTWAGPWTHLGIWFNCRKEKDSATLDLLSVRVIPREEAEFKAIVLRGHEGPVYSAAFSRDGSLVVTASDDGTARVWPATWSPGHVVLRGHAAAVNRAAYSGDGTRVVTASDDGTARIWRADGKGEPIVLRHGQAVTDASFSPDGYRVVTASSDHIARVWRADGTEQPLLLRGHESVVRRALFSPDGQRVATASADGTARVWSVDGTGETVVLRGHEGAIHDLAFSPDGRHVATASKDGTIRVWQADGSGTPIIHNGDRGPVRSVAFSPGGDLVVAASNWDTAHVWSVDGTGQPVILEGHQDWVRSAAFSPEGSRVVTGSDDGWTRVWRTDGKGAPVVLRGHEDYVMDTVFSPNGELVVSASLDGTARVWPADGAGEPIVLRGHNGALVGAVFSPDGTHVVTASKDGTARVWRITWPELRDYLRDSVKECLTPKQRMWFLAETQAEAGAAFAKCERNYGRNPDPTLRIGKRKK